MCKLILDPRAGSKELALPLRDAGLDVDLTMLPFGDIAFEGRGPQDCPWQVGIEYKHLPDVLGCITTGRFAGQQLIGMTQHYNCRWLLIEDRWRAAEDGVVQIFRQVNKRDGTGKVWAWLDARIGRRRFTRRELWHWLTTMIEFGGVRVHFTASQRDTVAWVRDLANWWTAKAWDEHHAHEALHGIPPAGAEISLSAPSEVFQFACIIPGVGHERARKVDRKFKTIAEAVGADVGAWHEALEMGATAATPRKVFQWIRGIKDPRKESKRSWQRNSTADGEVRL